MNQLADMGNTEKHMRSDTNPSALYPQTSELGPQAFIAEQAQTFQEAAEHHLPFMGLCNDSE